YLENDDIRNLFAIIAPYIQLEEKSNTSGTIIKVSDVISSYDLKSEIITKKNQALKKIITYFDNEKLSEILSLYSLIKDGYLFFSNYKRHLSTYIKLLELANNEEKHRIFNHYLEKTNFHQYILTSLYLFNLKEIFFEIISINK
ncbi:TPA: hypothetical protein N0X39_003968, partial [Proteus mirabilis]|nr:hypothetical protein [Proteus mirabilis]